MNFTFDHYTIQARLLPMFVLLLPVGLLLLVWFPATSIWMGVLETIGVPTILTALFSQLGRDLGKKKELALFEKWGGMPTDRILSASSSFLDHSTLARYRTKLSSLIPDIHFLDEAQELAAPASAVQVFRTCTNFLREKTRDRERFPLVFAENINYGFRRNLWAMKPAGLLISALATVVSVLPIFIAPSGVSYPVLVVAIGLNICLFVFWILRIKRDWVRMPAEEYARQLFAACENL